MPGRVRRAEAAQDDTLDTLAEALDQHLPAVFTAAQHTTASHRKHINTLHAVFLRCAKVTTLSSDGRYTRLSGEKAFGEKFREMVTFPLGVKKGTDQADRVIKFIAGFVGFAIEYDFKQREAAGDAEDDDDADDGPASRLVAQLLAFLLRGFQAKNKIARYRCVQLVALMINSLGEIDDESYKTLKAALLERVRDKEASVRQHAVVALSKLQDADEDVEDSDSEEDDSDGGVAKDAKRSVTEVLVDVLNHDPAAEVRRAALFNLIPSPETLPSLLGRTLDIDTTNRRLAFAHVLAEIPPKSLTLKQRQTVLGRGLRDREEAVRKAAKKLVAKWAEQLDRGGNDPEGLFEAFIGLLDVHSAEGKTVAEKALEALFEVRPDLIEGIELTDDFYQTLTPSTAFLIRTYLDYLRNNESNLLSDVEPVVTALAFYLQSAWTQLVVALEAEERDEDQELQQQFIVGELVGIAVNLDYGDEIGRRKMFELMREMLQHSLLPPVLIPMCLDVLLKGTSERDFMRIVVEIVQSLRRESHLVTSDSELGEQDEDDESDKEEEDEAAESETDLSEEDAEVRARRRAKGKGKARRKSAVQTPQQAARRKDLDLRCLFVVKALLERVMSALQENSMLHGLVAELIVPAVKTKDFDVRAQGLICLGLCCLLDKSMALDSFQLLARQSESTEGELQVKVLQTLFDLIVLHGVNFGEERGFGSNLIIGFLGSALDQEDPMAAATVVVGIAKLLLSGMVNDEEILGRLVLLYFASETADNPELRQCLSYFFPVYCYSNPQNQRRIASVMVKTLDVLRSVYDDLKDKSTMVTPLQIGSQLIDWTDPQKVIDSEGIEPDETVQVDLAIRMLKALYRAEEKEPRKLWCQLLPKLYIPEETDDAKVRALLVLVEALKENRPIGDTVSRNALNRFATAVHKTFDERLENLEDEARAAVDQSDEVKAIRDWVRKVEREEDGESESEDDDDEEEDDDDREEDEDEDADDSAAE